MTTVPKNLGSAAQREREETSPPQSVGRRPLVREVELYPELDPEREVGTLGWLLVSQVS